MTELVKKCWIIVFLFAFVGKTHAQKPDSLSHNKTALAWVSGAGIALYAGTMTGLSTIWYKDLNRVPFYFKNDNAGWKQIDKCGHAWSSYVFGKVGMESLKRTGISRNKAIWFGGAYGFAFLTSIEIIDGHYSVWGFSAMDMVANASGSALLIAQELAFNKQILTYKYSFHSTVFSDVEPSVFGDNFLASMAADYNGQTYWLSLSLGSVIKKKKYLPEWLCISAGYGAYGLLGAEVNPTSKSNGELYPVFERRRNYYLSLDIDFDKIKTRSKVLKTVFSFLNLVKVPFPTFEINSQGRTTFHPLYF